MQISPNELFSPLVGVILFFTEQDVIDRSSYMVYNSLEAANLADCMSSKIDNSFILKQSKWYKSDEYGVLQNITTRTQGAGTDVNKEAMGQSGSTSSESNNQPKLKYVQIDIPISKVLYQTITDSSFSSSQLLTPDELSKIIMSNLFSVLDNRLTIIRVIVEHLYKEKQIYRRMYRDYITKGYDILISINGFDMSEDLYISFFNIEFGNMILIEMLNGIKVKDDLVQHDAICKANLYLTSWERSFANLLREVKKSMMFQITDSQNQKAYVSSDSTSLQIGISISVVDLNICYMFDKLSMNSCFLQSNKQLLKKQFDNADIRPRLVLEIDFDENEIKDQETELTVDKFINSDYFTNVALHFYNLNIELKIAEIGNTEYSMYLDNCGLKLFKSLPARLTHLEMKNMHLTESIQIPHTFDTFVCRNVLVDEGCEIILDKPNLKVELVGVQGQIRHDFGIIVSHASSTIICTRISNNRIKLLKMVDICCQSKFICSNEIESLELIKAEMSGGRALFSGNCKKILVDSCSNAFNFKTMKSVNTLHIAGNLSKDFFDNLPITIQTLIIKDAKMNFNAIFQKELICLRVENIQVKSQRKFEMTNECKSITITRSTGVFNLFEKMNLIFDNQWDNLQEFILEKHDKDNLLDIRVAYAKMDAKNAVFENLKSITLKNVEIVEPLFLYIDNRLKKLEIHETMGKFEMNGIVTGMFKNVEKTRLGILSIVNIANTNKYTIKIEKSRLLVAMSITCDLEHLKLDNLTADKNFTVSVKGTCYHMELKKYTGSLEMLSIPWLKRISFVRADVDYNMMTQHFSLDGKLHSQKCQVPQNISSLKLENLVMSNQRIPDRHINLAQINIKRCVGVFNFAGLLNIEDLDLKLKSVIEMKHMTTIDAEVNLSHISFNQSLNFPNNISKLILTHVNFANGTNVEVSSECRSITIDHSQCEIRWHNMEELHPMRCTVEGIYVFTRDPSDSLLNFDLKDAQLVSELVIPNNIQKVRLVNVSEMQKFFITVNELCKTLLIENSTGIVICNSPMNLEKIVVSQSSLSALELHFSSSSEAMFDLNYEFEGGQNEQICVHIKNLCNLSFKHGCSNNIATISKLMSDETCDTSTLHLSESSYFAKDTKNAYDVDTADVNLITLLKGHLMIDITSFKRLNRKRLVQISITNSLHISQRRMD